MVSIVLLGLVPLSLSTVLIVGQIAQNVRPRPASGATLVDDHDYDTRPITAWHGTDTGAVSADAHHYIVCDHEADNNRTRAVIDLRVGGRIERRKIDRLAGAKPCTAVPITGEVVRHRVCELNHLLWDCDNWQTTTDR